MSWAWWLITTATPATSKAAIRSRPIAAARTSLIRNQF